MEISIDDLIDKKISLNYMEWFRKRRKRNLESIVRAAIRSRMTMPLYFCIWILSYYLEYENGLKLIPFLIKECRKVLANNLSPNSSKLIETCLEAFGNEDLKKIEELREQSSFYKYESSDLIGRDVSIGLNYFAEMLLVNEVEEPLFMQFYMYAGLSFLLKAVNSKINCGQTDRRFIIKIIRYGVNLLLAQEGER